MASCNVGPHLSHGHDAAHATSLDHTIWFHNFDFRADDWIFINAQSPNADSGTAFGACSIWTRDGKLIASGGQESLARLKTLSKL
uniref:Gluconolactonase n=2 Tax=Bursaphelenchus xylophilus TaxID=6326 RepID=A0A1I7SH26_BURXY